MTTPSQKFKELAEKVREEWLPGEGFDQLIDRIALALEQAVREERKENAKLAEDWIKPGGVIPVANVQKGIQPSDLSKYIAAAIRARGEKG